jgi:diguanylate cyclase (GGDEF)-like protein
MTIRAKILLGGALMLLPLLLLVAGALHSVTKITSSIDEIIEEAIQEGQPLLRLAMQVKDSHIEGHDYFVFGKQSDLREFIRTGQETSEAFEELLSAPFEDARELELVRSAHFKWKVVHNFVLSYPSRNTPLSNKEIDEFDGHFDSISADIRTANDLALEEIEEYLEIGEKYQVIFTKALLVVLGIGLLVSIIMTALMLRWVVRPLDKLRDNVRRFSDGDILHRMPVKGTDEISTLAEFINGMADRIEESRAVLKDMAEYDELTGLSSKKGFQSHLKDELERYQRYSRPFSILMVDIDFYNRLLDNSGQEVADDILRGMAKLLSRLIRGVDTAAHYEKDRFIVILPETYGTGAITAAERIRIAVTETSFEVTGGKRVPVTVSIGVAEFPADKSTSDELIKAVQTALAGARNAGGNKVKVEASLEGKV